MLFDSSRMEGFQVWLHALVGTSTSIRSAAKLHECGQKCTQTQDLYKLKHYKFSFLSCLSVQNSVHRCITCLYAGICGNVPLQVRAQETAAFLYYLHNTASLPIEGGVDLLFKGEGGA